MKTPSFSDLNAPKHEGLKQLTSARGALVTPIGPVATMTAPTPRPPASLLEFYLGSDVTRVFADMRDRPDHYSDRQKEIIEFLYTTLPTISTPVTEAEKDELILQFMRPTESALKSRDLVRDITAARHKAKEDAENEEIVMEDGTTLKDHLSGEDSRDKDFTFGKQDAGDKIFI